MIREYFYYCRTTDCHRSYPSGCRTYRLNLTG
nr:MAG TPA: hypothetical protein [Caudoviricetes sp.]